MKRRRALLLTLLFLLLLLGIPGGFLLRAIHQEQRNHMLIAAIKANDPYKGIAALKVGADPNSHDYPNDRPLSFGDYTRQFLDKLLHPHSTPETQPTALMFLFQGRPPEHPSPGGNLLSDMVLRPPPESPALLKALLEHGAVPNVKDSDGFTPLVWAAGAVYNDSVLLLLQYGSDINAMGKSGTALHHATLYGNGQTVRLLLEHGADVNAQDIWGNTPLMDAARIEEVAKVQLLLAHQANVNLKTDYGQTALDFATDYEHGHGMKGIDTLLRKAGAKPGTGNIPEHQGPHGLPVPK
jgi:ankyrin repeat protein